MLRPAPRCITGFRYPCTSSEHRPICSCSGMCACASGSMGSKRGRSPGVMGLKGGVAWVEAPAWRASSEDGARNAWSQLGPRGRSQ